MELDISEHIVMLYYKDIEKARKFYEKVLTLKKTMENDWVTLFQVTPHSFIGTVKEGGAGGYHRVQDINAVMVSIATKEIEKWYERLKSAEDVHFLKHLYDASNLPMKAILITDPGGYTVEFFQWNESE